MLLSFTPVAVTEAQSLDALLFFYHSLILSPEEEEDVYISFLRMILIRRSVIHMTVAIFENHSKIC
jgi:hypothetical protein